MRLRPRLTELLRRHAVPAISLLVPVAVSAACGVDDFEPVIATRPVSARFDTQGSATPQFLDVPFPSDAYMQNGRFGPVPGMDRVFKRGFDLLGGQLAALNGWSRVAPVMFVVDSKSSAANPDTGESGQAKIDIATLPADEEACKGDLSSVYLIDLEAGTRLPCRAIFHDESDVENGRSILGIGPPRGYVLEEGHRYAAVLTSRVKDDVGHTTFASDDFIATAVRKEGPLGALYGEAYDKVMGIIGGALAADNAQIVSLSPYTTQKITSEIFALRDDLEGAAPPTLKWDAAALAPMGAVKFAHKPGGTLPAGFTASLDDWLGVANPNSKLPDGSDDPDEVLPVRAHDKIAAFGTAMFDGTNYLRVRPTKYDDVEHATFARDAAGKPIPAPEKPTNKIWVSFAVPTAPMPPSGYPTVIIQHGLSSSRAYMMLLANRFASKGWMAVGIDSVTFGARAVSAEFQVDKTTDWKKAPGATYDGPDGLADLIAIDGDAARMERAGSFDLFGGLKNIGALRDQLRQAELDTAQLVKLLRSNPDLTPLMTETTVPKIDPDRIAYVGDSLGGIEGAVAAAIEPHVKAWTLNVAGAGLLLEVGAHAPSINANLALAGSLNFGFIGGKYTEGHPVVVIGQALGEGGDPIAYAGHIVQKPMPLKGAATKPRNIFQIEVLFDEVVSNEGNESLARAGGWGVALPNGGPNSAVFDLANIGPYRGGGIVLSQVMPKAGGFFDTPVAGATALVAQVSPATHGNDLVRSKGNRQYSLPFNTREGQLSLDRRNEAYSVPCPYRALQDTMLRFFSDAFEGKVPVIADLPKVARDADGDGVFDDVDPDPIDAKAK